jgi:tripartite-type tricarboxylate transporter receptor subunit TctC
MTSHVRAAALALAIGLGMNLSFVGAAAAQGVWPDRPVRMLISFPPGGSSDAIGRIVQPGLEKRLGQPVVIENRAGAGGMLAIAAIAKSAPDGYTIGLGGAGALAGNVALGEKMAYDPRKDLAPITALAGSPFILAAAPSLAANSLRDAIALSKRERLAVGHGGNGTLMHLTAEMFNQMAGTKLPFVPYKGIAPVVTDLIGGHVALGIVDPPSAVSAIDGGKIKALAVSSTKRFPWRSNIPTFAEQGLAGFESFGWFGIVAPPGTPANVTGRLNDAFVAELKEPAVIERIRALGSEPMPQTPAEFSAYIQREIDKWTKVVKASGGLSK